MEKLFPEWLSKNIAVVTPFVFFLAFMFCWGVFFEIDQRFLFMLGFGDYLIYFIVFFVFIVVLGLGLVGVAAKYWTPFTVWLVLHGRKMLRAIRLLFFSAMFALYFSSGGWTIFISICVGTLLFLMAATPMVDAFSRNEIARFRAAALFSMIGLSWLTLSLGQIGGQVLMTNSKRVYFIHLHDKVEVYANIILYTSGGIIFRIRSEVFFAPYDAIIFTRRTGMRRKL